MKTGRKKLLFFCIISICFLNGCFLYQFVQNERSAKRAMEQFHSDFNAGNYKKIYQESDVLFKSGRSEDLHVRKLEQIKNKLGNFKSTKITGSSTRDHNRGTDVYLYCETEYTNGKARENFAYVLIGDQVLLAGYEAIF